MEIQEILDNLELAEMAFQINEMAIYYGSNHGTYTNVVEAYKHLMGYKNGYVVINQDVIINKQVSQQDIDTKQFKPFQKDIYVDRKYPLVLVWGEPDKRTDRLLQGHGLSHILQGHKQQVNGVFNKLQTILQSKQSAKQDKYGNYTIKQGAYRFCFSLQPPKK